MLVGLKTLLEAAHEAKPQCFMPGSLEYQSLEEMEKERERKEAGWQSPPSADCCAVLGTRCICAWATPRRGDGCGLRCRPSQQPFASSNAEHVFYRNGAGWAGVRVLLSSMSPSHTLCSLTHSLACYMALVGSVCPQEVREAQSGPFGLPFFP